MVARPINPWQLKGYKAGQNVICKIDRPEPGGYSVLLTKDNLPGFLPTQEQLKTGQEILAQFVCVDNNRILLSARFSNNTSGQRVQSVRWEDYLPQLDRSSQAELTSQSASTAKAQEQHTQKTELPSQQQFEEDIAFQVWAQTAPMKVHLKRAVDLILPSLRTASNNSFKIADYDLEWLITDLEGGMRTCSVKAESKVTPSRSAMLMYRGRAVGCVYTSAQHLEPPPVEESLQLMLTDLSLPNTEVAIYDLSEGLTLAMSALFMGYPVKRTDDYDARPYLDYICNWLESKGQTACLAITLPDNAGNCFVYVHAGQFVGAFYVEDQTFTQDKTYLYQLLEENPKANVEVSILPTEMVSSVVRFGYSISMVKARH